MIFKLIIILVTAHIITDYAIQTPNMVRNKMNKKVWSYIKHVLVYFITALFLSINWFSWQLVVAVSIQTILHGIIDYFKIDVELKNPVYKFEIDVLDIFLHFIVIWLTIIIFRPGYMYLEFPFNLNISVSISIYCKLCIYVSSIIFLLNGGTYLVRAILQKVKNEKEIEEKIEKDNTGKLIGNIERLLLFILILFNNLVAIGFVITTKSIARFEEMKKKNFSEYYLIGTLSSTLIAIITGKFVMYLIKILNL